MIPSRRLVALLGGWAVAGLPLAWLPEWVSAWWVLGGLLILLAAADAVLGWRPAPLQIERQAAGVWPVGVWGEVAVTVHHPGGRNLWLSLFDAYPQGWTLEPPRPGTGQDPSGDERGLREDLPQEIHLLAGAKVTLRYRLRPHSRGDFQFDVPYLRVDSPLRCWQRQVRSGPVSPVRVFPDFSHLLGHTLQAADQRVPQAGMLRKRRRGEGTDFRQLREYRVGDSLRAIDWKATARATKPISREYQEERDQQVVFLLDTGRHMLARDGDTSHFDHALNAMLALAWIASKQGDAVGLMSFGTATRWLAPHKGRAGIDRLLAGVYDLQAGEVAPDYPQAAHTLLGRLRKRAFVVLLTSLRDEDGSDLQQMQQLLGHRHLLLCASLREAVLDAVQAAPVSDFQSALRLTATEQYLAERQAAIRRLGLKPGSLIDVLPKQLASALVDRYWSVKESGLL